MPLYEYTCNGCEKDFEILLRGGETPVCPDCGSQQLSKQFSVVAAHSASSSQLPICPPREATGCGRPQCASGGCQMM